MEAKVIKIGNSKGLRLSKTILDKYEIGDFVNLRLEKDFIVIEPLKKPRFMWESAFKEMHENGDDQLLINDFFDEELDWEWYLTNMM